jgi:hypothetical protein
MTCSRVRDDLHIVSRSQRPRVLYIAWPKFIAIFQRDAITPRTDISVFQDGSDQLRLPYLMTCPDGVEMYFDHAPSWIVAKVAPIAARSDQSALYPRAV